MKKRFDRIRNSAGMLLMALFVFAIASCGSKNDGNADELLATVPSSASMVGVVDIHSMIEKSGCKVKDNKIELSADMEKALAALGDGGTVKDVVSSSNGVAIADAVFFQDGYNGYMTLFLDDPAAFKAYVEKKNNSVFENKDGVDVCGTIAVAGNQAWFCTTSNYIADPKQLKGYAALGKEQSFVSGGSFEKLMESEGDVKVWGDINSMINLGQQSGVRSMTDMGIARLAVGALFDDASSVLFNMDFEKGKCAMTGKVLNSKGSGAKFLLPVSGIDPATLSKLGKSADMVMGIGLSKELVKKIQQLAGSFGGALPAQVTDALAVIDGTAGLAMSSIDTNPVMQGVVTTTGKDDAALISWLNLMVKNVKKEGKYVLFSQGDATAVKGSLDVAETAGKFKNAYIGLGTSFGSGVTASKMSAMPEVDSMSKTLMYGVDSMILLLKGSGDGIELQVELLAKDKDKNFLEGLVKEAAAGK